jgi:hypothetical protein
MMMSETCDDLDPWLTFIAAEFDNVALFNFHDFDAFCPMDQLLPTKFVRRLISTVVLFTHRNCGCSDHFHVTYFVNGWPREESPGQY